MKKWKKLGGKMVDIFITSAIVCSIGIAILASITLVKKSKVKRGNSIDQHYNNIPVTYDNSWKEEKVVISSEKIQKLKEKELDKKAEEAKARQNDKEVKKTESVLKMPEEIRAGEVQRSGTEQFNLRKDEESSSEDENWWL